MYKRRGGPPFEWTRPLVDVPVSDVKTEPSQNKTLVSSLFFGLRPVFVSKG